MAVKAKQVKKAPSTAEQKPTKQVANSTNESSLYSIYGARMSKSGERVNVSIVKGSNDTKQFATISIKLKSTKKVQVRVLSDKQGNQFAYIKVPFLLDNLDEEAEEAEDGDEVVDKAVDDNKDLPF